MSGTKCFCENGTVSHAHFVQVNLVILAQKCIFEPQDLIFRTSRADPSESARDDLYIGAGFERNGPELQKLEAFEVLQTKSPKSALARQAPGARASACHDNDVFEASRTQGENWN